MLRGLTTTSFWASGLDAARDWYTELLRVPRTSTSPATSSSGSATTSTSWVVDSRYAPVGHTSDVNGSIVHWHVDHLAYTLERLRSLGATEHEGPKERGPGFVTASLVDPFGNILGIMYNAHYLEILRANLPDS
ncbi:VOC family protein [Streptomyces sp. NPDC001970]